MKANLKGRGGIKGMFLLHGEKIAIVLVGLAALWFVYSSLQLPKLEDNRQATDLQNEITQTNNVVKESQWPEPSSEQATEVRIFEPVIKRDISVPEDKYKVPRGWNPPVVAPSVLRVDPPLLNPLEPRAIGNSGLLAYIDENVRKARALAAATKDAELAKKARDEAQRQQQEELEGQGGNRRNRRGAEGEFGMAEFDPEHPKRRPVEGMARAAGVPLQGDERIEKAYWATVVAKVPIRQQMELYQEAFENAKGGFDPARDFPRYMGYLVERSEVVRGKPLEWKRVPVYDGQKQAILDNKPIRPFVNMDAVNQLYQTAGMQWAGGGQMPDVIDERFFDFILTLPLPPLVGRDWGTDATHPDIPLAINTPPLEEEVLPIAEQPKEEPADGDDSFRSSVDPNQGQGLMPGAGAYGSGMGGERGGYGGISSYGERGGGYGGERGGYGGGYGGERGGYGGGYGGEEGGRGGGGYAGGRSGTQKTTLPKGVDYWLLRFFDFTVEPGKKYKYRVKLALADPNHGLPNQLLSPEVQDRESKERAADKAGGGKTVTNFRVAEDWSEPTQTVGIPLEGSVRLAQIKPAAPGRLNDEPLATLLVESFSVDENGNAIQAAKEKAFRRGYVANMIEETEYVGPDGRWIDTIEGFKFLTGITLLDVDGGEQLSKDAAVPGRALLMGPAGELFIRKELDDKPAIDLHKMIFEKDKRGGRNGEGDQYRGEDGGRGGYGAYGSGRGS
jgi:hypothetical protein